MKNINQTKLGAGQKKLQLKDISGWFRWVLQSVISC